MENALFYKSVLDMDKAPVVICDLQHTIIYMNSSAIKNYEKSGGAKLIGQSLLECHNEKSCQMINRVIEGFKKDKNNNIVYMLKNTKYNKDVYMVALRDEKDKLIGYYEKHEFRNGETMKPYDID